jgi:hypothetical protein
MRQPLPGVTVRLDGTTALSSSTIAAVGASVLVIATTLPEHAIALTSAYLVRSDGALAVSHLRLRRDGEDFQQHTTPSEQLHATLAGACLLEHAAVLRELPAEATGAAVGIDVDPNRLVRVTHALGPAPPPG